MRLKSTSLMINGYIDRNEVKYMVFNDTINIDLNKPLARSRAVLASGDDMANCFGASIYQNGEAVDISGYAVTGYFVKPDGDTLVIAGSAEGNTALVTLHQACYAAGSGTLAIKVSGVKKFTGTVRVVDCYTRTVKTDNVYDPGEAVPTLDDIFAQIAAMEAATAEANTAAADANEAREGIQDDLAALAEEIKERTDFLSSITGDHFREIQYTFRTEGNYYKEVDGNPIVQGQRPSSGMMPAPRNLCLDFGSDNTAKSFIYFYNKNDSGDYEVTFDLLRLVSDVNSTMNYVSPSSVPERMIANIPDGTYMEICKGDATDNPIILYGWDGEPFGMDVCTTPSIPIEAGSESWLSKAGGSGITVSGKAKHIIAKGAKLRTVHGFKDGEETTINGAKKSFYTLPDGYDYFRIRLDMDTEDGRLKTFTGDVRNMVYIVAATSEERPISNAVKVIENCERVCNLTWTPRKAIVLHNNTTINFKPDIEYNGLIYSSQWDRARIVGWHVSPHTFLNAVNDENSIMYNETADNGEGTLAPIYGTVCSAFATMCDGWECPQTNAGFFYDPDVERYYSHKPQLGQIYTDIKYHCVIPAGLTQISDDSIVSAYEAVHPVSVKTARFMTISHQDIWEWWNLSGGLYFYNDYGYVVHNPRSNPDMSTVPYADFANATVTGGSARPYKGDKSVYTSEEAEVKINIKNEAATVLCLEKEGGSVQRIPIDGASVIDVKPYLDADSIYHVYTDVDATRESFEYKIVKQISCVISGNSVEFSDNSFWYADCTFAGIEYYQNGVDENGEPTYERRNVSVMANADGNYESWFATGNKITSVNAIFFKGKYGAYTVPITQEYGDPKEDYDTVEVDPTLTKEGMAADAKAVGDQVAALTQEIDNIKGNVGEGNGTPGADGSGGGYYTPSVEQINEDTMRVSFAASDENMPSIANHEITLPRGKDGYTPQKGVDYFDGKDGSPGMDGSDGQPGKDGVSVTVKSVSESTADSGNNVVTFSDGETLTVKNGSKGSKGDKGDAGADGTTPIKGTDYFTEADKAEMVAAVKDSLPTETWTFTLSDGSTVTRKVVIG